MLYPRRRGEDPTDHEERLRRHRLNGDIEADEAAADSEPPTIENCDNPTVQRARAELVRDEWGNWTVVGGPNDG